MPLTDTPRPESDLIADAQAGSESAMLALIEHYEPAIKAATASRFDLDHDDARQEVLAQFVEIVHEHDGRVPSLGPYIRTALLRARHAAAPFAISPRTLRRWSAITREADGDHRRAADLAPKYEMTRATYLAIAEAVNTEAVDLWAHSGPARPLWQGTRDAFEQVEARDHLTRAFRHLDPEAAQVVARAYGFGVDEPMSDGAIAAELGLSRPKVQRIRTAALKALAELL